MISADKITLCCVDTAHHALSAVAIRRCLDAGKFAKTVFITDKPEYVDEGWECHRIKPFEDYTDFNKFMLKGLYYHIETEYVLVMQFDGFIIHPELWSDEFLAYDYIGAPWPCLRKEYAVGTGGFSLRSKKLLKALQDDRIVLPPEFVAEDLCICRTYRSLLEVHHDIQYAPVEVAERFCYESGPPPKGDTFGFHSLARLADMYVGPTAPFLVDSLQPYLLRNPQTTVLATQYAYRGQHEEASRLFRRIAEHQDFAEARVKLIQRGAKPDMIEQFDVSWQRYIVNGG